MSQWFKVDPMVPNYNQYSGVNRLTKGRVPMSDDRGNNSSSAVRTDPCISHSAMYMVQAGDSVLTGLPFFIYQKKRKKDGRGDRCVHGASWLGLNKILAQDEFQLAPDPDFKQQNGASDKRLHDMGVVQQACQQLIDSVVYIGLPIDAGESRQIRRNPVRVTTVVQGAGVVRNWFLRYPPQYRFNFAKDLSGDLHAGNSLWLLLVRVPYTYDQCKEQRSLLYQHQNRHRHQTDTDPARHGYRWCLESCITVGNKFPPINLWCGSGWEGRYFFIGTVKRNMGRSSGVVKYAEYLRMFTYTTKAYRNNDSKDDSTTSRLYKINEHIDVICSIARDSETD